MDSSSSPSAALPWHHRLEARVLLGVTLGVGVSLLAILFATRQVVTHASLTRASEDLLAARTAFNRLVEGRLRFAAAQTRLVTELPTFQALVQNPEARADAPTMNQMAADYCGKLGADFCIVSDPQAAWIGRANYEEPGANQELQAAIETARSGRAATGLATLSSGLFLIVAEPFVFDQREVLGTFTSGYRLDDAVAAELSLIAHCDVNFLCGDDQLCGSSLSPRTRTALAEIIREEPERLGAMDASPSLQTVGDTSFVGGVYPLHVTAASSRGAKADGSNAAAGPRAGPPTRQPRWGPPARLVLLQDWTPTERALRQVQDILFVVGLATFLVALGGGLVLSRHMTRPLRHLADVSNEIAGGNWTRRVPVEGPLEARAMAETFNRMTVTLSHWHREAKTRTAQLEESYERFRAVTNSANDAIVSVNRRGEIVFWNLRAQHVFGYEERHAIGQPLTLLMPERHRLDYADEMARLLSGESRWVGSTVEISGLRRDGSEVPVELSLSTWEAGQEQFYTAVIRDISERKQAAEALRQREEQLRQAHKMEAVGRLAGGIAHDFNNLLTAILGYADLLIGELPADDQPRKDAEEIQKAGRSAASLVRDLLAFSRKQVLQPVVLDVNAVVKDTENLLRRLIGEHIDLTLVLTDDLDTVRADRSQLEQVLVNLAVNARDAMPGGGTLAIRTSVTNLDGVIAEEGQSPLRGPHVVLTVADTGHGMSPETRARIFEPFFTTKPVGQGTGLGLATVYGVVKQSGGHIWVESEMGKGTAFNVALPGLDAAATAPVDERRQAIAPGSELVLLVEDNDSVRSLARETLVRSGYRVLEARNGEEALSIGATHLHELSLLLTDVVMPVMGGRELAKHLTKWRPGLKVIFTSGYVDERVTSPDSTQWGAMFLQKPFTPVTLGRAVRDVLDRPQAVS